MSRFDRWGREIPSPASRLPKARPIGAMLLTGSPGFALTEVREARVALAPLLADEVDWESGRGNYRAAVEAPEGAFTAYASYTGPTLRTAEISFFGRSFDRIVVPMGEHPDGDVLDDPTTICALADATLALVEIELGAHVRAVIRPSLMKFDGHHVIETAHARLGLDTAMLALAAIAPLSDCTEAASPFYGALVDGCGPDDPYLRTADGPADQDFRRLFRDLDARLPAIIRIDTRPSSMAGRIMIEPEGVDPTAFDETRSPSRRPLDAARALADAMALPPLIRNPK